MMVNNENKVQYIEAYMRYKLITQNENQIKALKNGIRTVFPKNII